MRCNCTTCLSWPVLERPSTNSTLRVKSWTGSSSTPSSCMTRRRRSRSLLRQDLYAASRLWRNVARKSHELSARQQSATPTTDSSLFPRSQLVMITWAGNATAAPLPESADNGVSEVRYIADSGACSFFTGEGATVSPDETSVSPGRGRFLTRMCFQTPTSRLGQYQVGAPRARRPLAPDRTSGEVHYIGIAPKERHYGYAGDAVRASD